MYVGVQGLLNPQIKSAYSVNTHFLLYLTFVPALLRSRSHSERLHWWFHSASLCCHAWPCTHCQTDAGV